jgi:arylsulfatase A-like enzyme
MIKLEHAWLCRFLGLGLVLASCACVEEPIMPVVIDAAEVLRDPHVMTLDASDPSYRFEGGGGSLLLGDGWATPEKGGWSPITGKKAEGAYYAWAVDDESEVFFYQPFSEELDFYAVCRPYPLPDGTEQTVTMILNGVDIGTTPFKPTWQRLRIPLPPEVLEPGLNRLLLRFGYAVRPVDVEENQDTRRLAVMFYELAVAPRGVKDPSALIRASQLDPEIGELTIPEGGAMTMPLAPASHVELRFWDVIPDCTGCCALAVELINPGGEIEQLWRGPAAAALGLDLSFSTPTSGISQLALSVSDLEGAEPAPWHCQRKVTITFGDDLITITRLPAAAAEQPPIFVYVIDALRADIVTAYNPDGKTPHMAALAEDAVTYLDAWAPSTWTLPSTISLMTGVYPDRHKIMKGDVKFSSNNVPPLATLLGREGYETVAISQSYVASSHFGADVGFDQFFYSNQLNGMELRSQEIRRFLGTWLVNRSNPEQPFYCYIHTVDPHAPYQPVGRFRQLANQAPGNLPDSQYRPNLFIQKGYGSDPKEVAHLRALYEGEVIYADAELGRFIAMLKHLDLYEQSLVVVLSDHGEEFGEHGGFDHGRTVYNEVVNVPLIVKYPGGRWAGSRITRRVSTLDLVPTIRDLIGADWQDRVLDGESLIPEQRRRSRSDQRVIYAELNPHRNKTYAEVDLRTIAVADHKCIESLNGFDRFKNEIPRWRSFDIAHDVNELSPLDPHDADALYCQSLFEAWVAERRTRFADELTRLDEADAETHEKLKALGYVDDPE